MKSKLRQTDLAYMAGLFDGGGCVGIYGRRDPHRSRGRANDLKISVSSSEKVACQIFKDAFGGSVQMCAAANKTKMYAYQAVSRMAYACLTAILPYLKLKREQTLVCLDFQRDMHYGKLSDEEWELQEKRRILVKEMKRPEKLSNSEVCYIANWSKQFSKYYVKTEKD